MTRTKTLWVVLCVGLVIAAFLTGYGLSSFSEPTVYGAAAAMGAELDDETGIEFDLRLRAQVRSALVDWHAKSPKVTVEHGAWKYSVRNAADGPMDGAVRVTSVRYGARGGQSIEIVLEARKASLWQRLWTR